MFGKQPHEIIVLNVIPALVEEKATIEIAIPGDASIGVMFDDGQSGALPVFRQHRVRYASGKAAIWLVMNTDKLDRYTGTL